MHVFDDVEKLIKIDKVEDLIAKYTEVRLAYYVKRKAHQVVQLEKESCILSNKARFITELLDDSLDLRKKKTAEVSSILKARAYHVMDDDTDYKYLVRLPMDSVTEENITKIISERDRKLCELAILKGMTEKQIWLNELSILRKEYIKVLEKNKLENSVAGGSKEKVSTVKKVKVTKK